MRIAITTFSIILGLVFASKLLAYESISSQTQEIIDDLNSARSELNSANSYRDRVSALSNLIMETEKSLGDLRSKYRVIKLQTKKLNTDLIFQKEKISELAGALLIVGKEPIESTLLHPGGALSNARSKLILSDTLEGVRSEARTLNKSLNKLMLLTNLTKKAEREMRVSLESIQTARAALIKAASDRTDLPVRFIEDPEKLKSISKSSKSLNEFAIALNSIEKTIIRSEEPISKDYAGSLSLPVEGIIVRKFNDVDAAGILRPGIVIRTKNREIVTSPISATIRYAGPLLDYGMVSILEPEDGVLLIFAGLGRVFGKAGQILSRSSPIGFMAGQNISAENFITETELSSGRLSQSLYIEVRYNDKPQDPSDWFEIDKE